MKHIIAAIALLAATMPALALDRTQEYRMWSAERMISRLVQLGVNDHHPTLQSIREVGASGDDYLWSIVVGEVHKIEDAARK